MTTSLDVSPSGGGSHVPAPQLPQTPARRRAPRLARRLGGGALGYASLVALSALVLLPLGWMLTVALTPDDTPVFTVPVQWWPTQYWEWANFTRVLTNPDIPLLRYVLNTLVIVFFTSLGTLFCCAPAAYAFARLKFRGRDTLFGILIVTMLIPWQVLMIPLFIMFFKAGWYGTYLPLIIPAFFGSPINAFFIFLMRQYMRSVPRELDEAATIDGANRFQIFWHIILPLAKPILYVTLVFNFLATWNDLLGPLIYLTDQNSFTISVGMANLLGRGNTHLNNVMASNLIMMTAPLIVFFFAQKRLIGGLGNLGLKG
jgi:multiple sugar transport system permease protein